jgi:hypothetical protein
MMAGHNCQHCGKPIAKGRYTQKVWISLKYCGRSCAYKKVSRRPEHQCMECHVLAGVGVKASARLAGRSAGAVSAWRKQHGLKTKPAASPYWLSIEERARRAQEDAFLEEHRAWQKSTNATCWSNSNQVRRWRSAYRYAANIEKERQRSALSARKRHERLKDHPQYKIKRILRNAVSRICRISKTQKDRRVVEYVGCTMSEARRHIERQFVGGMTWANHGELWEIDHIVPLSHFDLTDLTQRLAANHYKNLQPLWKWQNRAKAGKLCLN